MLKLLIVASLSLAQPAPGGDSQRIDQLIERLGSGKFQERNAAQKELETIGTPALEQLKKSQAGADAETSRRAGEIVRKIQESTKTADVLAAKSVRLKFKDIPVVDAVAELSKASGYSFQVMGDKTKL